MIDAEEEQRCVEGKKINDFIIKCTFSQIHFLRRMSERSKKCIERKKFTGAVEAAAMAMSLQINYSHFINSTYKQ